MPTIDERIVSMQFDNKQFEKGVSESLKTLDDLKKGLSGLDESSESLKGLQKASEDFNSSNLHNIADSVEKIASKFTFLGRIGMKVMDDLADATEKYLKKAARFVTGLDGMQAGMSKYEQQTKAVQTITNATGKSVAEVEKVLEDLMWYTDETSYDFSTMVSTIGKFTAAGVDLETAEKAMEGIANEAAKSGAGIQEANRAMYNFSQALSTGKVSLIDWKSIENANMATKEFKETIIETAVEAGTLKKGADGVVKTLDGTVVTYKNFNSTLQKGWFTSNVMLKSLEKYADRSTEFGLAAFHAAQEALTFTDALNAVKDAISSGWMQSFKYIFGDLDEARKLWTGVANGLYDFVSIFFESRNEFLKGWHDGLEKETFIETAQNVFTRQVEQVSGYKLAVEALTNAWDAFAMIVAMVVDTISEFLPDMDTMIKMAIEGTERFRDMTAEWREMFQWNAEVDIEKEVDEIVDGVDKIDGSFKKASKGEGVKALQEQLNLSGYDVGNADGVYGPKTQAAVKKLQHDLGIKETGMWDAQTKAAVKANRTFQHVQQVKKDVTYVAGEVYEIEEEYEKVQNVFKDLPKAISKASDSEDIKALQEALNLAGYDAGNADGIYGPKTQAAVKKLQHDLGLEETGIWDEKTAKRASAKRSKQFVQTVKGTRKVQKTVESASPTMLRMQNILRGVFSILDLGKNVLAFFGKALRYLVSLTKPVIDAGLDIVEIIANCITGLNDGLAKSGFWDTLYKAFKFAVAPFGNAMMRAAEGIKKFLEPLKNVKSFGDLWKKLNEQLKDNKTWQTLSTLVGKFSVAVQNAWPKIKAFGATVFEYIGKFAGTAIDWLIKNVPQAVLALWNFGEGLVNSIKNSKTFQTIWENLKQVFAFAKQWVPVIALHISNALKALFNYNPKKNFLENLKDNFSEFVKRISNSITAFGKKFPKFKAFIDKLRPIGETIKEFFKVLSESIGKFFSGNALAEGKGGSSDPVGNILERFQAFEPLVDWFKSIGEKLKGASSSVDKGASDLVASASEGGILHTLLEKSGALGEFLKGFDFSKFIGPAFAVVGVIALASLAKAIGRIGKSAKVIGEGVAGMTGSIGNFFKIGGTSLQDLVKNYIEQQKNANKAPKDSIGTTMLKMAGAIAIVAGAVALLSVIDANKALAALPVFVAVLSSMAVSMLLISKTVPNVSDIGKSMLEMMASIAVLAASVWLMTKVVKGTDPVVMAESLAIIAGTLLIMGHIEKEISKNSKGKVQVSGVLSMCVGIYVIALAVGKMAKIIQKNTPATIIASLAIIELLLITVGAIGIKLAKAEKDSEKGVKISGVLAMCAGVWILVAAVGKMVKIIQKNPAGAVVGALIVIEAILITLGVIEYSIAKASSGSKTGKSKVGGILAMAAGVYVIVLALSKVVKLVQKDSKHVWESLAIIEILLITIGSIAVAVSKAGGGIGGSLTGLVSIIAFAGAILAFGAALELVKDIPWSTIAAFGVGFKLAMDSITIAMAVLSHISPGGALMAVLSLDIFLANLILVLVALAGIQELTNGGLGNWLEKGAMALGQAIGGFIKGIVDGIRGEGGEPRKAEETKSLADFFNNMIGDLDTVVENLKPFLDKVSTITDDKVTGVLNLVKVLAAMSGAELLDSVSGWVSKGLAGGEGSGSGFVDFMNSLVMLVDPLKEFSEKATGLDGAKIDYAAFAMEGLGKVVAAVLPLTGGQILDNLGKLVSQLWVGGSEDPLFVQFAKGLSDLVPHIIAFSNNASDINLEKIQKVVDGVVGFSQVAEAAGTIGWGGFKQNIMDLLSFDKNGNTMLTFVDKVNAIMPKMKELGENSVGIKTFFIQNAANALKSLADISDSISRSGGTLQKLIGEKNLDTFGSQLGALGKGIRAFYDKSKEIPPSYNPSGALNAISSLADIGDKIERSGGMIQAIIGEKDIGGFGDDLATLGKGLNDFAVATADIPPDYDVTGPLNALGALSELEKGLEEHDGIKQWFTGDKDLGRFGEEIATLGENFKTFDKDIKGLKFSNMESFTNILKNISEAVRGMQDTQMFADSITNFQTFFNYMSERFDYSPVADAGDKFSEAIATGINRNASKPRSEMEKLISRVGLVARSYYNAFVQVGEYFDRGLAQGIYNNGGIVVSMMNRIIDNAIRSAMSRLKINSPSRVGIWLGEMFDQGLANGLLSYQSRVANQSGEVAQSAVDSARFALQAAGQTLINDTDMAPTIRPVLDLTDIQAGASGIGGLFGSQTVAVGSTVLAGKISAKDRENSQYTEAGNNVDMASAIGNLNDRINQLDETISNLQVVMDTGALVGQLTPGIDKNLGKRQRDTRR